MSSISLAERAPNTSLPYLGAAASLAVVFLVLINGDSDSDFFNKPEISLNSPTEDHPEVDMTTAGLPAVGEKCPPFWEEDSDCPNPEHLRKYNDAVDEYNNASQTGNNHGMYESLGRIKMLWPGVIILCVLGGYLWDRSTKTKPRNLI